MGNDTEEAPYLAQLVFLANRDETPFDVVIAATHDGSHAACFCFEGGDDGAISSAALHLFLRYESFVVTKQVVQHTGCISKPNL